MAQTTLEIWILTLGTAFAIFQAKKNEPQSSQSPRGKKLGKMMEFSHVVMIIWHDRSLRSYRPPQ
jgi:hypothetical protein